ALAERDRLPIASDEAEAILLLIRLNRQHDRFRRPRHLMLDLRQRAEPSAEDELALTKHLCQCNLVMEPLIHIDGQSGFFAVAARLECQMRRCPACEMLLPSPEECRRSAAVQVIGIPEQRE